VLALVRNELAIGMVIFMRPQRIARMKVGGESDCSIRLTEVYVDARGVMLSSAGLQ
jgi:hypothetical protein